MDRSTRAGTKAMGFSTRRGTQNVGATATTVDRPARARTNHVALHTGVGTQTVYRNTRVTPPAFDSDNVGERVATIARSRYKRVAEPTGTMVERAENTKSGT